MISLNSELNRGVIVAGIIVAVLLQIVSLLLPSLFYVPVTLSSSAMEKMMIFSRLLLWLSLLIVYVYAVKIEKQTFFLNEEKRYPITFYILSVSALIVTLWVMSLIILSLLKLIGFYSVQSSRYLLVLNSFKDHKWLIYFTTLTAGIMEELMFRVYILSRLQLIFKNVYMPVIVSSLLFGLIHYGYGTVQNIVVPIFIGVVFGLFYIRFRNIKILIISHFLYDLILVILAMNYHTT